MRGSLRVSSVAASGTDGNVPNNVLDGNFDTRWSSYGIGQYITADLGSVKSVCSVQIAWYVGNERKNDFTVSLSSDGASFTQVFSGRSSGTTTALESYDIPDGSARYVRITVNGNTLNRWASITELRVSGGDLNSSTGSTGDVTLFSSNAPVMAAASDSAAVELGMKFQSTQAGSISAIRFYRGASNPSGYTVKLYTSTGTELVRASGTGGTAPGWHEIAFATPVNISANTLYVASYYTSGGRYAITYEGFSAATAAGPLTAPASGSVGGNGVYRYGLEGGFPTSTYRASNYFVDVRFKAAAAPPPSDPAPTPADTTAPLISMSSPASGATVSGVLSVTGTASDNVGVSKVELQVDGGPFALASGTTSWSFALDTTRLTNGSHTLTARVSDAAGNATTTAVAINVSNSAPSPSPTSGDPTWPAFPAVGAAGTFYVDAASGSDTNPGTQAQPWRSIAKAASVVQPGSRVLVRPGIYNERPIISRGGASNAGISFEADGLPAAKTLGFEVRAQYVRIKGFEISGTASTGVTVAADNVQIGKLYIRNMPTGIGTHSRPPCWSNIALYGNKIEDATFGMYLGGRSLLVENNEINRIKARSGIGDCDYSRAFGDTIVFRGNRFHGTDMNTIDYNICHLDNFQFYDNNGDYIRNLTMENNLFADSHQGMMMEAGFYDHSYGITVRNNVFTNQWSWGICIKNNIDNWFIDNNTFVGTQYGGVGCDKVGAANINVRNNIFVNMHRAYWGAGLNQYGNNLIYQTRESSPPSSADLFGVEPRFLNSAARDFRLSSTSPAINRGRLLNIPTDFFGTPRPQGAAFDMGMHEFTP